MSWRPLLKQYLPLLAVHLPVHLPHLLVHLPHLPVQLRVMLPACQVAPNPPSACPRQRAKAAQSDI